MPYRTLQYPSLSGPVTVPVSVETITLDKWKPAEPVPRQAAALAVSLIPCLAFTALVPPVPVYAGGQSCEPISIQCFQYDSEAVPVQVEAAAPEIVTVDKWDRGQSQPQFRIKRTAEFTAYVMDSSALLKPERASLDKWVVRLEQPRRDISRRLVQYGTNTATVEQADNGLPLAWMPPLNQPRFGVPPLRANGTFACVITEFNERISLDKWAQPQSRPRQDIAQRQSLYQFFVGESLFSVPGLETVTVDKWFSQQPEEILRLRRLTDYGQSVTDVHLLTQAEGASLDKWEQPQSGPRRELRPHQFTYPSLAIDSRFYLVPPIEIIRLDKWNRQYPDLIFRPRRLPDYGGFTVDGLTQKERAQVDKWGPSQPLPRVSAQGRQYIYPTLAIDNRPAEIVLADKWQGTFPDLISRGRWLIDYGQLLHPILIAEAVGIDKWFVPAGIPQARLAALLIGGVEVLIEEAADYVSIGWMQPPGTPRYEMRRVYHLYGSMRDTAIGLQLTTREAVKVLAENGLKVSPEGIIKV